MAHFLDSIGSLGDGYPGWASFRPGAWVRYKSTNQSGACSCQSEAVCALLEIDARQAVVDVKVAMTIKGMEVNTARETIRYSAVPEEKIGSIRAGCERGREEIVLGDRKIPCDWLSYRPNGNTVTKIWRNPEIPGGVAKVSTLTQGVYPTSVTMIADGWGTA